MDISNILAKSNIKNNILATLLILPLSTICNANTEDSINNDYADSANKLDMSDAIEEIAAATNDFMLDLEANQLVINNTSDTDISFDIKILEQNSHANPVDLLAIKLAEEMMNSSIDGILSPNEQISVEEYNSLSITEENLNEFLIIEKLKINGSFILTENNITIDATGTITSANQAKINLQVLSEIFPEKVSLIEAKKLLYITYLLRYSLANDEVMEDIIQAFNLLVADYNSGNIDTSNYDTSYLENIINYIATYDYNEQDNIEYKKSYFKLFMQLLVKTDLATINLYLGYLDANSINFLGNSLQDFIQILEITENK